MNYNLLTMVDIATDDLLSNVKVIWDKSQTGKKLPAYWFIFHHSNPLFHSSIMYAIYLHKTILQLKTDSVVITGKSGDYWTVTYSEKPIRHLQLTKATERHSYQFDPDFMVLFTVDQETYKQYTKH